MALFCVLAFAFPIRRARGDTPLAPRAIVVAKDIDAPMVAKLRAELTARGFDSLAVWGPPSKPSPSELASVAHGADARGLLRLDETARTLEVWLTGANGASPVLLDTVRWTGADDVGAAAVRAAEVLHGAVFPVLAPLPSAPVEAGPLLLPPTAPSAAPAPAARIEPPAVPPPVALQTTRPPAPPAPAATPARFARFTLAIGVNAIASPGGIGPMADVSLATAWHPVATWSVGVFAQLPVLSASLAGPGATPQVGATLLGAEVAHGLGHESWKVHPDVALGAGALLLHFEGASTSSTAASATAQAWMFAAVVRGGLATALARDWRLRADAMLGVAFPEADVDFGPVRVATWGRPFVTGGISVEFVLR